MSSANRLIPLDLLRAVAVLLVLGSHAAPFPEDAWAPLLVINRLWGRAGWMGVDLFFVLSGFLVSGLLFREYLQYGRISVARFLIRRGFKIYPAFYFFIVASYLIQDFPLRAFVCELFFVQNYGPSMWNHTWSLAVEEHFYLCLPPLLLLLCACHRGATDPFRRLPMLFGILAVALLGARILVTVLYPYANRTHVYPTHLRIDSLFFGVLLSYFYHFHAESLERFVRGHRWWLAIAGTAAILPPFILTLDQSPFLRTAGFSLLYLGFGSLMLVALICGHTRFTTPSRWIRFWAYLGSHSYSVYLWHIPVWLWLMRAALLELGVNLNYWQEFLAYVAASFGWGVLAAKGIEFPMLQIRDRLFPALTRPIRAE